MFGMIDLIDCLALHPESGPPYKAPVRRLLYAQYYIYYVIHARAQDRNPRDLAYRPPLPEAEVGRPVVPSEPI
jgi:hypothetical protein